MLAASNAAFAKKNITGKLHHHFKVISFYPIKEPWYKGLLEAGDRCTQIQTRGTTTFL
jgi:hypothetical protein